MVEDKNDEAVIYVNSKTGFNSDRIVKCVDYQINISNTDMEEEY